MSHTEMNLGVASPAIKGGSSSSSATMAHYHHHHRSHSHNTLSAPSYVSYSRRSHPSVPTSSTTFASSSASREHRYYSTPSAPTSSTTFASSSASRQHTYYPTPARAAYPHAAAPTPPAIDPVLASRASIEFDLTLSPSHILIPHSASRSSYAGLTPRDLARPATSPPQPALHIRCADLLWPIDIYPASASGSAAVSVGDVLHGIYRALRHRASASEWHASSSGMQQRVRDAWLRRCKRQQSHKERTYESNNGLRRVDWLTKYTVFRGLTPGRARDEWVMHVGQGEKSVKFWTGT